MEAEFVIDIGAPKRAFETSLNLPENNRLIFSAPFGSGKTFFLKRFFSESENYLALHLYPVNYSASKNEDIFEFIKYDILYVLLNHKVSLSKMDVGFIDAIPFLDAEEQAKAIGQFLSFIPKLGKTVVDVFAEVKKLGKTIEEKRSILRIDEAEDIKQFVNSVEQTKGSIYEVDFYSNLIINLIERLKTESGKEIVLIVDDLDRIDPDHIFRLLNIFASHLDLEKTGDNKFGFDKVIFSCDIENIRTIFHNKFGQEVDFSGYIDKFYSREVFEFNNKTLVAQSINRILTSIKIDNKSDELNYISKSEKAGFSYLKYLLISFVNSNAINLRILLKLYDKEYQIRNYSLIVGRKKLRNWRASIITMFDFLTDLFGDTKALRRAIDKTIFTLKAPEGHDIRDEHIVYLCGELIMLADIANHKFVLPKDTNPYQIDINGRLYRYHVEMYDFRNERYTSYLLNESDHRLHTLDDLDVKAVISRAYDCYLKLEKNWD